MKLFLIYAIPLVICDIYGIPAAVDYLEAYKARAAETQKKAPHLRRDPDEERFFVAGYSPLEVRREEEE